MNKPSSTDQILNCIRDSNDDLGRRLHDRIERMEANVDHSLGWIMVNFCGAVGFAGLVAGFIIGHAMSSSNSVGEVQEPQATSWKQEQPQ